MKLFVPFTVLLLALSGCGGGGGGSSNDSSSESVAGLEMPVSLSVVVAQDDSGTSSKYSNNNVNSKGLFASLFDTTGFGSTTDYASDEVNTYVYDKSMESLDTVNMILCLLEQTKATDMVNQGAYIALVNEDKCEQGNNGGDQSSTGQSSGGQATEFNSWTILSTRASSSDPQIVKIWVPGESSTDPMDAQTVLVEVTVNSGVSTSNPYGKFTMNFKGVVDCAMFSGTPGDECPTMKGSLKTVDNEFGQPHFNFVNVAGDDANGGSSGFGFTEQADVILGTSSDPASDEGVALTGRSVYDTGFGFSQSSVYAVAFNAANMLRGKDDNGDNFVDASICNSRTNFDTSVWRYNLYHSAAGTFNGSAVTAGQRVALNSGFPFEYDSGSDGINDSYGWLGYHGMWTEDDNAVRDGNTITQFDYDNDTEIQHTVHVSNGKLIKRTKNVIDLSELVGEDLQWWGMHPGLSIEGQWIVRVATYATDAPATFQIQSTLTWGNNGPETSTTINTTDDVIGSGSVITATQSNWMGFWSDSLGGSIDYVEPATGITKQAKFYAQEFVGATDAVFSGGSSVMLYCYDRCLKGGLESADITAADPTIGGNGEQDLYYPYEGTPFTYTLAVSNGKISLTDTTANGGAGAEVSLVGLDLSALGFDWGFRTGSMVVDTVSNPWEVYDADVSYEWETGDNAWNRMVTVTEVGSGAVTTFDPPLQFAYTHDDVNDANDQTGSNPYINNKFMLEYNGPGDLWGFPWVADQVDANGNPMGRWSPAVTLLDDVELTDGDGTVYVVRAIEKEQTMKEDAGQCTALNIDTLFTSLSLPAASSIGTVSITLAGQPTVTAAPAVIEGELQ